MKSYSTYSTENFYTFKYSLEFIYKNNIEELIYSTTLFNISRNIKINYELYIDNELNIEDDDFDSFLMRCNTNLEEDCSKICFNIAKDQFTVFTIIDADAFSNYLNSKDYIESATLFYQEVMDNNFTIQIFDGEKINKITLENRVVNNELKMVSKSFLLFKFFSTGGDPDLIFDWSENFSGALRKHLRETASLIMLSHLSTDFDIIKKSFVFSGYKEVEIFFDKTLKKNEQQEVLQTVYQWVFSGQENTAKLGILSNVISLFSGSESGSLFDQNLKRTLFSNYKIYLKGNIERYIEVKNKVSEFAFDLSNKLIEHADNFRGEVKKSVFAVYSFFFMSVIFTGIDKGKINNIFNFQISALTILFLITAIFYIKVSKEEFNKKVTFSEKQLDDLKNRYSNILDSTELEEVFQREIITEISKTFDEKKIYIIGLLLCILLIIFILIGLIYNVGLSHFVEIASSFAQNILY